MHHVGILYDQIMMHGQRNIKLLSGVLYGCETWSLTIKEERRLRLFENRVLEDKIWA